MKAFDDLAARTPPDAPLSDLHDDLMKATIAAEREMKAERAKVMMRHFGASSYSVGAVLGFAQRFTMNTADDNMQMAVLGGFCRTAMLLPAMIGTDAEDAQMRMLLASHFFDRLGARLPTWFEMDFAPLCRFYNAMEPRLRLPEDWNDKRGWDALASAGGTVGLIRGSLSNYRWRQQLLTVFNLLDLQADVEGAARIVGAKRQHLDPLLVDAPADWRDNPWEALFP
jgi:hypothetical protein